jgi:hypothetical protein
MTPPNDLVDRLLTDHSAEAAFRTLKGSGYDISIHRLHTRISQLISTGKRQPIAHGEREMPSALTMDVPRGSSLEGSEKLLRAQIRAGQVFPDAMARWEARHGRVAVAA